jgi:nucleolar protein 9
LFIKAAPVVTAELKLSTKEGELLSDGFPKMEEVFVNVKMEIEEHLGYLMTNTFASHPLRILLLVLSGEPLVPSTQKHILHSRRKEHVSIIGSKEYQDDSLTQERQVPTSFNTALETIIYKSVAGLDTNQLRALAPHRVGNPILQLLLRLELSKFGKQRGKEENSILHTLLPDENLTSTSPSSSFIVGLIYDTVGSRLLETILEFAPAKTFKAIYKDFFKDKLSQLSRNDTASYVVCKVLCRVGKEDIQEAVTVLGPEIPSLVDRNRFNVIRTLIERAVEREADLEPLAGYINTAFSGANGTYDLTKLLKLNTSPLLPPTEAPSPDEQQQPSQSSPTLPTLQSTKPTNTTTSPAHHASLVIQTLLTSPLPLSQPALTALTTLPATLLLTLARSPAHAAPLLTTALSTLCPAATPTARRKLIAAFYGHFGALALDPTASRALVVDAVWPGTRGGLAFMRERVAEELAENEAALRAAPAGRRVWRAWDMERYRRRRREWVARSRAVAVAGGSSGGGGSGFVGFPEEQEEDDDDEEGEDGTTGGRKKRSDPSSKVKGKGRHLTALERARERHAREKARREREAARVGGGLASGSVTASATAV